MNGILYFGEIMLTKAVKIGTLLCCHTLMILNLVTVVEDAEYDGAKKVYKKQPNIVIILADDMVSHLLQEQKIYYAICKSCSEMEFFLCIIKKKIHFLGIQ